MQTPKPAPLWFYLIPTTLIILNFYTIVGTLTMASEYSTLNITFSPALRLGLALFWIIVFSLFILGLILRRPLAFIWIAPMLTLYGLANILITIVLVRADYVQGQIGFQVITTLLALLPIWWFAFRRHWIGTVTKPHLDNQLTDE